MKKLLRKGSFARRSDWTATPVRRILHIQMSILGKTGRTPDMLTTSRRARQINSSGLMCVTSFPMGYWSTIRKWAVSMTLIPLVAVPEAASLELLSG